MTSIIGGFGPWAEGIPAEERAARYRELRALASLLLWRENRLVDLLGKAASDPEAAEAAWREMHALPSRRLRRLLCSFASLGEAQQ